MAASLNQTFTCDGNDHVPTGKDIFKACMITCVMLGIIIGNVFSVVVFNSSAGRKSFLKKVRLTMNSLICTDLSMGILVCPSCIYSALFHCWPFGEVFCKVEALLLSALFHESTLSLVLIALDRYFSVHHYLRYNFFMTSTKYIFAICSTWVIVFMTYAIVIFIGDQFYFDVIGINCEPYYENRSVTMTVICLFYIVPALLFLYSYGSIFSSANRKQTIRRSIGVQPGIAHGGSGIHHRSDFGESKHNAVSQILKTSKYLAAISLGFFIAISPWTICTFIIAMTNIKLPEDLDFAITWLAISNSFWNVIIYSILNRKFRRTAGNLMRKHRAGRGWVNGGSLFGSKLVADPDAGDHNDSSQRHYNSCADDFQSTHEMVCPDCMIYSGTSSYTMSESPMPHNRVRRMTSKLSYTVTSIASP